MSVANSRLRRLQLPNAWLLGSLVLLVLVYPFLQGSVAGRAGIAAFDLVILMLALRAARAGGYETRIGWVLVVHIWLDFTIMILFGRVRPYVALTLRANLASIALVMFFSVFTVPLYAVLSLLAWGKSQYRFGGYASCIS